MLRLVAIASVAALANASTDVSQSGCWTSSVAGGSCDDACATKGGCDPAARPQATTEELFIAALAESGSTQCIFESVKSVNPTGYPEAPYYEVYPNRGTTCYYPESIMKPQKYQSFCRASYALVTRLCPCAAACGTPGPATSPTTMPSTMPTSLPTSSAPSPTDECDSKLFQQYNETGFKVASKNDAFTFITKIKTAFKAIKKSYRAAKTNLRKLGREAKE